VCGRALRSPSRSGKLPDLECLPGTPHVAARGEGGPIQELASISLFERLSKEALEKLHALTQRKKYPKGTAVFFQDDPSDSMYVVLSGSAKVYQTSEDGHERILKILKPGEVVGELAMLEGRPRSASVETLEPSELLSLSRKDFEAFGNAHPQVLWELLAEFAERLRRVNEDVLDMSFRDVPYRMLRVLSQLLDHHGEATPEGWRIALPLSVRELASMVGSNPETVGRLLDRYESEGLLKRAGNEWVVPDKKALTRALEFAGQ
jgi:CRP-like cAMP-binding protein